MTYKIELKDDLIINNVEEIKSNFLGHLKKSNKLEIDLSETQQIDISGLQLLISLVRESKNLEKEVSFIGLFNNSFSENLNRIAFAPMFITNGEELQEFLKGTV